jgi:hypothetical protein
MPERPKRKREIMYSKFLTSSMSQEPLQLLELPPHLTTEDVSLAFLLLSGMKLESEENLPEGLQILEQNDWENLALLLAVTQTQQQISSLH